jgi:NAD(P)H-hydrate epimerase
VLIVGPGLEPAPTQFVERLLEGFDGPMVVDAGAVTAIRRLDSVLERRPPTVLTPHAGEVERLTGVPATHVEGMRLAAATGSVVVLKGNPTFVAGRDLTVARSGGPELASIGTGDVLAGTIGAFLARGIDTEEAAWSAAVVHGVAGAALSARTTLTAPALAEEIGAAVTRIGAGGVVS